jgi:hypothetical protein
MGKHIKITRHFNAYNPGEIAHFDDEVADQILTRKLGEEVKVDKSGNAPSEGKPVADQK